MEDVVNGNNIQAADEEEESNWEALLACCTAVMRRREVITKIESSSSKRRDISLRRRICTWENEYMRGYAVYSELVFRCRFCIPRTLYTKLNRELLYHYPADFEQKVDAAWKRGHCSHQKMLWALLWLVTGGSCDDMDESCHMCEESIQRISKTFYNRVIHPYGK